MSQSEKRAVDQLKRKVKDLDRNIEVLEKNVIYLSALVSLVASKGGITKKDFHKLIQHAARETGKSYDAIKFFRIMKGFKSKK
jgi:hypothetical protein